jgi:hypothetical protein
MKYIVASLCIVLLVARSYGRDADTSAIVTTQNTVISSKALDKLNVQYSSLNDAEQKRY